MRVVSRSRRRSRSLPWSSCSSCACRGSPRWQCRSVVSTPRVRPPASLRVATMDRLPVLRKVLRQTGQRCSCGATVTWSSQRSPRGHRCCRASPSRRRPSPRPNLDERGSASLVAVAIMAVLLAITTGGAYVGSAVIARHRAQAAADLAALAAAAHLAEGTTAACGRASALARTMRTTVTQCAVDDLDVLVTVEAPIALGRFGVGPAGATARAGPVENRRSGRPGRPQRSPHRSGYALMPTRRRCPLRVESG